MAITNFTQRENAYRHLEQIEALKPYVLYFHGYATSKEAKKLEKHLNRVAEGITDEIKQFELKIKEQ